MLRATTPKPTVHRGLSCIYPKGDSVLLAYIDEIGQTGAFIHPSHERFADSPAFGYGGFVIPEDKAREFGATFARNKRELFKNEIPDDEDPGRWEKKGADLLFAKVAEERPQNLRVLGYLISRIRALDGNLFYYAEEKPIGSPKETNCGKAEFAKREEDSMRETLNRLARHADYHGHNIMVMMDQINEKSRKQRLPIMYAHILGRATEHKDMRKIIEPPMHVDSKLSANIQFADWICALVKRAIEYQLVEDSRYSWVPYVHELNAAKGAFTYESKLRLHQRSIDDLNHSNLLFKERPVLDGVSNGVLTDENRHKLERVKRAALRAVNQ